MPVNSSLYIFTNLRIDDLVKSPIAGHCEERSDEAIPWFQRLGLIEIASLRSQ
jgi:hypothetical protein